MLPAEISLSLDSVVAGDNQALDFVSYGD